MYGKSYMLTKYQKNADVRVLYIFTHEKKFCAHDKTE